MIKRYRQQLVRALAKRSTKPTVGHLHISGMLNSDSTRTVVKILKHHSEKNFQALAVSINSAGGSAAQASIIIERVAYQLI